MGDGNSENKDTDTVWDRRGLIGLGAAIAVLVLWSLLGYIASTRNKPADFGDMFGAASALFSGLAFAGLVYTIALQRSELVSQRENLAETRRELRAQTKHFEDQNRVMREQALNSTFFQLLSFHNNLVNAIDLKAKLNSEEIAKGRDCFKVFLKDFRRRFENLKREKSGAPDAEIIQDAYRGFYEIHQADVGHYFRSLYNMVKIIHRSDFSDRRLYTNLVRAQLSSYEQVLLLYNCLTPLGSQKFKPLIEEYGLFKNFPFDLLISEGHKMYFSAKAFV